MAQSLSYCGQLVKEQDPDRFLISMLMDSSCRESLWALFAFNHEIAKTREVVSETALGHIRLQWWRDAIASVYEGGAVPEHEVMGPLSESIRQYDLPRKAFDDLIYAREFDLENIAPAHLEGLLIYADHTQAPLMKLAMQICGDDIGAEPVQPVAINYALAGILRSVSFHKAQGRSFLPTDLVAANDVTDVVKLVIEEGVAEGSRSQSRFLSASDQLAQIYLKQIKGLKYDVLSPKMAVSPPFIALRMLAHALLS
ncbi:MAG: hypothetical protein DHS20C02_10620 [Micavibrio sp.]|nr:MAG: hypothetical protein DHS20C02_10620 [Micavibrio sp.]